MLKSLVFIAALSFAAPAAFAEETPAEKASATANDAKRSMKKGANRAKEIVCLESDAECLAKKAKHRATEGGDYMKDKAKETKDKID